MMPNYFLNNRKQNEIDLKIIISRISDKIVDLYEEFKRE